jgi:HK97 family phage major capsid protein
MVDGSPVLAQPVIKCQRWTAFVPFSWELAGDWRGLENELVRLIADGRDVMESTMFYSGGGTASSQPAGILCDLALSGTTYSLLTAGTVALAAGDIWSLREAIPARWSSTTTFLAHPVNVDRAYRLVPNASTVEPALMDSRDGALTGRPVAEWSAPASTITTGSTMFIAGDINAAYTIVDRVGLTALSVPVLFGGTAGSHFPTGESGLVVWGRSGAGVTVPNALRVLVAR